MNLETGYNVCTIIKKMKEDLEDCRYEEESRKSSKLMKNLMLIAFLPMSWAALPSLMMITVEVWRYMKEKMCSKRSIKR